MLAIGVGCRIGASAEAIVALVRRALERAATVFPATPTSRGTRAALFTAVEKQGEAGLREAATLLAMPLVFLPKAALAAHSDATETRSERVVQLFGVPSLAETAALAGAGQGSHLIVARLAADGVTCAIACQTPRPVASSGA
jgi:cobalt-precorrin 5A hydrolase